MADLTKSNYLVTAAAGPLVAGFQNKGVGSPLALTAEQARYELLLGTIVPDGIPLAPQDPAGPVSGTDRIAGTRSTKPWDFSVAQLAEYLESLGDGPLVKTPIIIASAPTVDIGNLPSRKVTLTGSATITSFGTAPNVQVLLLAMGAVTLVHNDPRLTLPGGENLTMAVGDRAVMISDASGNWSMWGFLPAAVPPARVANVRRRGRALVGSAALNPLDASTVTPSLDWTFAPGFVPPAGAFGRPSTGTYRAPSGLLLSAAAGELRHEAHELTGENLGALIQDARTNHLLQSDAPAVQTVSLAAGTYVAWVVEGTGSLTLSGGAAGVATPGAPFVFTLSVSASVTVTPSGVVTKGQIGSGSFPSSYIPTTTGPVTRAADAFQWTLPASFWSTAEGTFYVDAVSPRGIDVSQQAFEFGDGGTNNRVLVYRDTNRNIVAAVTVGGTTSSIGVAGTSWPDGTRRRIALAVKDASMSLSIDGAAVRTAPATGLPPATLLRVGDRAGGGRAWNGAITQLGYIPRAVAASVLPLMSA